MRKTAHKPSFSEELLLRNNGLVHIAGIDEVGRGAIAGPLIAAAVILPGNVTFSQEVYDSKLLSPLRREILADEISEKALALGIGEADINIINTHGIVYANQYAFRGALEQLHVSPDFILSDAFPVLSFAPDKQKAIIKGDEKSISIAAASILAKVYRDNLMCNLGKSYKLYGFSENKGYGTLGHRKAIRTHGLSDMHRTCFNLGKFLA